MICFQAEDKDSQLHSKEIQIHITPQSTNSDHCLKVTNFVNCSEKYFSHLPLTFYTRR